MKHINKDLQAVRKRCISMLSDALGRINLYFTYKIRKKDNATSLFDWGKYYEKEGKIIIHLWTDCILGSL